MKRLVCIFLVLVLSSPVAAGVLASPQETPSPRLVERVLTWIWVALDVSELGDTIETYPLDPGTSATPTDTTSTEIEEHTEGESYPSMDPDG